MGKEGRKVRKGWRGKAWGRKEGRKVRLGKLGKDGEVRHGEGRKELG